MDSSRTAADQLEHAGLIRRRSGTVAAVVAVLGFAAGSLGYQALREPERAPVILRQATETDRMSGYDQTPGAGGALVLLRNDGTTPIEVIDAAFSRTTAEPPLYVAPETVAPGADVNVFVPLPGACSVSDLTTSTELPDDAPPVRILVSAHRLGAPVELVPVDVSGELAAIMQACHRQGRND
jgi:hypothetical protein